MTDPVDPTTSVAIIAYSHAVLLAYLLERIAGLDPTGTGAICAAITLAA